MATPIDYARISKDATQLSLAASKCLHLQHSIASAEERLRKTERRLRRKRKALEKAERTFHVLTVKSDSAAPPPPKRARTEEDADKVHVDRGAVTDEASDREEAEEEEASDREEADEDNRDASGTANRPSGPYVLGWARGLLIREITLEEARLLKNEIRYSHGNSLFITTPDLRAALHTSSTLRDKVKAKFEGRPLSITRPCDCPFCPSEFTDPAQTIELGRVKGTCLVWCTKCKTKSQTPLAAHPHESGFGMYDLRYAGLFDVRNLTRHYDFCGRPPSYVHPLHEELTSTRRVTGAQWAAAFEKSTAESP